MEVNWEEINKKVAETIRKYGGEVREGAVGILWIEKQPNFPKIEGEYDAPVRLNMRNFGGQYLLTASVTSTDYDLKGVQVLREGLQLVEQIINEAYDGKYEELRKAIEEAWKARREAEEARKRQLVEEFNKLPKILWTWTYSERVQMTLERDDAEYNPRKSSRILGSVNLKLRVDGVERNFWVSDYVTDDGKIRRKKLLEALINIGLDSGEAEKIVDNFKTMLEMREQYYTKYELGW